MSGATEQRADASPEASAPMTPFSMVSGDPNAMVCDGDVCFVPPVTPAR